MLLTVTHIFCLSAGFWLRSVSAAPRAEKTIPTSAEPISDSGSVVRTELGVRLTAVESRLSALEPQVNWIQESRAMPAPTALGGNTLEMASRLARSGTSVDGLMEICDLGRGEAELIRTLNADNEITAPDDALLVGRA